MKTFKNYFTPMLLSMLLFTVMSCENTDSVLTEKAATKSEVIENSSIPLPYLGFEGDLHDPFVIWKNMDIYSPAYNRMAKHLKIENNQLTWDCMNAAELNISQNIYDYITFMWNLSNEQLKSGEYTLESNNRSFKILPKRSAKIIGPTPQILLRGEHVYNMRICRDLVRNVSSGWLGYFIDLMNSEMQNDGWGGRFITGDAPMAGIWSYAAFDACGFGSSSRCELNNITATNSYETGNGDFYEKVMNYQWAPLVVVRNAHKFKY